MKKKQMSKDERQVKLKIILVFPLEIIIMA